MFKSNRFDCFLRDPALIHFSLPLFIGLISETGRFGIILFLLGMPLHELGHAFVGWLRGRVSIPTFFVTGVFSDDSLICAWALSACLSIMIWVFKKKGRSQLMFFFMGILCLHGITFYGLSGPTFDQISAAAGIAGELLWAPVIIFLSYENLGAWWSNYNKMVINVSALSLGGTLRTWIEIKLGKRDLPFGSFLFGPHVGDLNTLVDEYHWSRLELQYLFISLGFLSILLSVLCIFMKSSSGPKLTAEE